jgi:sensor c-di-GMP phosphodiesterase-like protein
MPFTRQRVAVTLCATVALALCGVAGGYAVGRIIALRLTAAKLKLDSAHALSDSVAFSGDAHRALNRMKASKEPACSEADLLFLRQLVFHSLYLKEVGRLHNGGILCSAALGRLSPAAALPAPNSVGADGVKVYWNLPLFKLPQAGVTTLLEGDSFVVLNPYVFTLREHEPLRLQTLVIDGRKPPAPVSAHPLEPILDADSDFRIGDRLYSTRCSLRYDTCITVSILLKDVLLANRMQIAGNMAIGGAAGALLGFFVSIAYKRRRSMEQQLRRAIRHGGLRLAYQPIHDLRTRRIVGAEALARWTDEDGIAVNPEVFFRLAEQRGFVGELTEFVVQRGLLDFREILRRNQDFRLSVNITASDLADAKFLPMLDRCLAREGVAAQGLTIEITESSTASRPVVIEAIHQLRKRGHAVQIDDFGTGYSSLAYLKDLAVDAIKIDKTFTHVIGTRAVTQGILPQIMALARTLNLEVIAEGIETEEQAEYFAVADWPVLGQGWFFCKALPMEEFEARLQAEEVAESVIAGV